MLHSTNAQTPSSKLDPKWVLYGIKIQLKRSLTLRETQVLGEYVLVAIALVCAITYGLGADLTIAARYHFFYFPAVAVLVVRIVSQWVAEE